MGRKAKILAKSLGYGEDLQRRGARTPRMRDA